MADRQTRVLGGNGTSVQAFTLDPGLLQYVQSVFVTVDNTAGADIQPTLTVQTNNGVALAKKQQGRSISAGVAGSATWALRLDDESGAATPTLGSEKFLNGSTDTIGASSDAFLTWVHASGDSLLDLTAPKSPTMKVSGVYAFTMSVEISVNAVAITSGRLFQGIMSIFPAFTVEAAVDQFTWSTIATFTPIATATLIVPVAAGTLCRFDALSTHTSSVLGRLFGRVQQLA